LIGGPGRGVIHSHKTLIVVHFFLRKWAEATARHELQAITLAVMPAKAGNQYLELDQNCGVSQAFAAIVSLDPDRSPARAQPRGRGDGTKAKIEMY
jgi:hypothetical protein